MPRCRASNTWHHNQKMQCVYRWCCVALPQSTPHFLTHRPRSCSWVWWHELPWKSLTEDPKDKIHLREKNGHWLLTVSKRSKLASLVELMTTCPLYLRCLSEASAQKWQEDSCDGHVVTRLCKSCVFTPCVHRHTSRDVTNRHLVTL